MQKLELVLQPVYASLVRVSMPRHGWCSCKVMGSRRLQLSRPRLCWQTHLLSWCCEKARALFLSQRDFFFSGVPCFFSAGRVFGGALFGAEGGCGASFQGGRREEERARQEAARLSGRWRRRRVRRYHAARNKFERFRGFLELISRFEFEFRRRENYFFERFDFLVCSEFNHTQCGRTCACALACVCPQNSISNVVVRDDMYIYIQIFLDIEICERTRMCICICICISIFICTSI